MKDLVPGRMGEHVKIGASVPVGLDGCRLVKELKLGNILLTLLPTDKEEAMRVAEYCRENGLYLIWSELLYRGSKNLCWAARRRMARGDFYSKKELEDICRTAGKFYLGRMTIGEAGGMLYWPKEYTINRRGGEWDALPSADTADIAKQAYVDCLKSVIAYEREKLGSGPLWDVDASNTFKYHLEAGVDMPLLEQMPGDSALMMASLRGAAKAYGKPWSVHVAMSCYGGVNLDRLWLKRWKISLLFDYIAGCSLIYPESGHFTYDQTVKQFGFSSSEMLEARRILREFNQFSQIHSRPVGGPRVKLGIIYGNLDGYPGLWNKYAWGQYHDGKWQFGPAEYGWELLDDIHKKGRWDDENIQGGTDFYGNPPYGQYDVVPIEAPIDILREYSALVFLGWNTMTEEIYQKLCSYVKEGGHLFMSVPHLSTETDRGKEIKLLRDGDLRELFGLIVKGRGQDGVAGIKTIKHSSLPEYKMPVWRVQTDPRFLGDRSLAQVELHGARVLSGWSDFYVQTEEDVERHPVLTEYSLGAGKSFLLCSWDYPGDKGWAPYMKDLLRIISYGEQGDIRVISGDKIRYAVYDGKLPGSGSIEVAYIVNTEYDTPQIVDLWIKGKLCRRILVEPSEMRLAYILNDIVISPEDRGVELEGYGQDGTRCRISMFSRSTGKIQVFNISDNPVTVSVNGRDITVGADESGIVDVTCRIDPDRPEFYAEDFLKEPSVDHLRRDGSGNDGMAWTGRTPY